MTLADGTVALSVFAILIAFVVPQFSSPDAKEVALQRTLQDLRDRIDLYRFQNESRLPGDEGTEIDLIKDLQRATSVENGQADTFPTNPINGKTSVVVSELHPRDGSSGWWYRPSTGEIRANIEKSRQGEHASEVLTSL